jgi:hypothetical protein
MRAPREKGERREREGRENKETSRDISIFD